jgi:hypothetical protein
MHINIINKPEHDNVTFGLVAVLVIVVGVLGYIVLRIWWTSNSSGAITLSFFERIKSTNTILSFQSINYL